MPKTEIYVGNLVRDITRKEIEDVFEKYGRLRRCDLKNKGFGQTYAFLEFDEESDAEDALKKENGKDMAGEKMIVEWAKAKSDRRDDRFGGRYGGGGDRYGYGRNGFSRGGSGRDYRGGGGMVASRAVECYQCGERGHYARDCRSSKRSSGGSGGHRRRDSRSRTRSRSRSRDHDRKRRTDSSSKSSRRDKSRSRDRSHSRDPSREKSHSKTKRERHHSKSVSPHSKSRSRSRSKTVERKSIPRE